MKPRQLMRHEWKKRGKQWSFQTFKAKHIMIMHKFGYTITERSKNEKV